MKSVLHYVFLSVAALVLATALGFMLGTVAHQAVARVMHVVATI